MGEGFWAVCLGMAVAAALGFILVMVLGLSEEKAESAGGNTAKAPAGTTEIQAVEEKKNTVVCAPMTGTLIPLEEVKDAVFSSGTMGKGIAIDPEDGVITAPFDGTVTAVYPTKHAVGLTTVDGVGCIIHVGVDTANLQGKHFDLKVQEGQKVKTGDVISQVDLAAVIKEGYSLGDAGADYQFCGLSGCAAKRKERNDRQRRAAADCD